MVEEATFEFNEVSHGSTESIIDFDLLKEFENMALNVRVKEAANVAAWTGVLTPATSDGRVARVPLKLGEILDQLELKLKQPAIGGGRTFYIKVPKEDIRTTLEK